ncbi:hypothetical protein Tco_1365238, partial [Tanacetum coccineum]
DVKTASTPIETHKPLLKDADGKDVDEHLYRSMIGSLMYLTSSRHDIIFAVCACARFQVNPKSSHLCAVKRIFRYLKGQPKLGLWYPKDSPFDLVVYTDSDYAGASLDRKSITGGCQFLGCRLIMAMEEADRVKNPVFHSKKKHIEIRHHFIRDYNENKLIQMIKIHIDQNVADFLIKAFDVSRFKYLIAINPTIYTSCIEQFWTIAMVKTINEEVQIQALVDKKKLTLMSAKTTAWNEFSSTMASAIICLARNQKFNFSKYIFDNMVKNLEGGVKVIMYPRFVQVFLDKKVEGMSKHKNIYVTPSQTKKVFANMKRQGKDFSGSDTPLFPTMIVQAQEQVVSSKDEGLGNQEDASKQGRKIDKIDQDAEVTLVDETQGRYGDNLMFDTHVLDNVQDMAEKEVDMDEKDVSTADPVTTTGEVVSTANVVVSTTEVTTDTTITTVDELTLAQALIKIKAAKPKVVITATITTTTVVTIPKDRGVVVQEPSKFTITTSPSQLP